MELLAPVSGKVVALDDVPDKVFASRALGEGVGIQTTEGTIVAPVSGELVTVAKTGHAFGIRTADGVEVLVHVGIDTVQMKGEGFDVAVAKRDHVKAGDVLATVDLAAIEKAGHDTTTVMTVTNSATLGGVTPITGIDATPSVAVISVQR